MKKLLLSTLVVSLSLFSCKEEATSPVVEECPKVKIMLEHQFNGEPLDFDTKYVNANGDTLQISELKYFLSNLIFVDNHGNEQKVADSYYLVEQGEESNIKVLEIEGLEEGTYSSFKLSVGVDSVSNHSVAAATGDLDPNGADQMIWAWNTGYKFIRCEGDYASAVDNSSGSFVYHVGGDANFKTFHIGNAVHDEHEMHEDERLAEDGGDLFISLEKGKITQIHLVVNLAELFVSPNQINVKEIENAAGENASLLMDNISHSMEEEYNGWFELHHIQTN